MNKFARALRDTARVSYCQSLEVARNNRNLVAAAGKDCKSIDLLHRFDSPVEIVTHAALSEKKTIACHCEMCLEVLDP